MFFGLIGCDEKVLHEVLPTASPTPSASSNNSLCELLTCLDQRSAWIDKITSELNRVTDIASARAAASSVGALLAQDIEFEKQFDEIYARIKVAVECGDMSREPVTSAEAAPRFKRCLQNTATPR